MCRIPSLALRYFKIWVLCSCALARPSEHTSEHRQIEEPLSNATIADVPIKPWCDRAMVASDSLDRGEWHLSKVGLTFELARCRLKRPSASRARACLKDRHLMLIGDSVSRYMYLTLAMFLSTGEWETDETLADGSQGSICHERSFGVGRGKKPAMYRAHWRTYYSETNRRIRGNGSEVCDCYRDRCCGDSASEMTENRYTYVAGGRLTFINQMSSPSWHIHGHVTPAAASWEAASASLDCTPGACNATSRWSEDLSTFVRSTLPKANVTDIVMNWGHHWSPDMVPARKTDAIFAGVAAAVRAGGAGAFWRTTTMLRNGKKTMHGAQLAQPEALAAARRHNIGVLDFLGVTRQLRALVPQQHSAAFYQFDDVHYVCSVNRELNYILLNRICVL